MQKCNSISTNPKDDQNDGDDLFNNITVVSPFNGHSN